MSTDLGYMSERKKRTVENVKRRREDAIVRNDALLESGDFRSFLGDIATRAGYFSSSHAMDEWYRGYTDALRDIVNGIVNNSTTGSAFLAEILKAKADKTKTGE